MMMRRQKDRFTKDYETRLSPKGKTEYVYKGPYFKLTWTPEKRRQGIVVAFFVPICSLALFILGGMTNGSASRHMIAAPLFVTIVMPILLLLGDAYKLLIAKGEMKRAEYERCILQMKHSTLAGCILSALAAVAALLHMVIQKQWEAQNILFFCVTCGLVFLHFLFHTYQKKELTVFIIDTSQKF